LKKAGQKLSAKPFSGHRTEVIFHRSIAFGWSDPDPRWLMFD
jgi:hypothetical protein